MVEGILNFVRELKIRNESLFYFVCLSILFVVLTKLLTAQVNDVNAWFKLQIENLFKH